MPTITDLRGPAGRLEALLDTPEPAPRTRGRGVRASAPAARRDDAHKGRVSGREGADAHRVRGPAIQLSRRRRERRRVRSRRGRAGGLPRRPRLHDRRAIPACRSGRQASRSGRGSRSRSAPLDPRVSVLIGIAPPVVTSVSGQATTFENTLESTKPKFFVQGEADEVCPLEGMWQFYGRLHEPKELVVIDGASHLFDGQDTGGRRGPRGPARRFSGMKDAVIVSAVRTAAARRRAARSAHTRPDEMAATVIKEALARAPGLDPAEVEDVILGCAMPEAEQGLNVARIASLRAGIPVSASASPSIASAPPASRRSPTAPSASCPGSPTSSSPAAPSR